MATDLSPENEQFIQQVVASGAFEGRVEALNAAVGLLKRRQELLRHIDEGTAQLKGGQYTDYDQDGLRQFLDEVQAQGRQRYEASKRPP